MWESASKFKLSDIKELSPAVEFLVGDGNQNKPLSFSRRFLGVKLWGLSSTGIPVIPLPQPTRIRLINGGGCIVLEPGVSSR
jgi:hypothetical protein